MMRDQYIRGGEVFIIVYSVTDQNSFIDAKEFYENVLRVRGMYKLPKQNHSDQNTQNNVPA